MQISQDDILDALRQAMQAKAEGEQGMTVQELCEALGKGEERVRKQLKTLIASGTCIPVRVRRTDMAGRDMVVPGYRFKGGE